MAVRIAVIDDERPARSELRHQLRELVPDAVIEEGDSGAAALELAGAGKYDIFFLDINLGDINGTVLVNALKNMQRDAKIIFVTAYSEYAVTAFELGVEDYILKPYDKGRLKKVLERMQSQRPPAGHQGQAVKTRPGKIAISNEGKTIFEDIDDIIYIETHNRGCMIHTAEHGYYDGKSIGEFEKRLEGDRFFRCHKSYLINLDKVREVFPWGNNSFGLKMQGAAQEVLPVGRERTKVLRQLLGW
ncbi:DNA-binding response regulator [Lachnospiraceae bacterium]|uniref:LytR/AlgR family response regulator transcription factor n=1 Tax=Extibacter sp. GGCC_0201 TaxID=2731209 RepID=UPI001AA0BA1A|nr:LytTR family DNA-binding domain-containing protein [Extibacter sp. GGCC_0201]MBO1721870.1 response regulator transcription factor [Extibacter sp. GGCC_0201]BDF35073.1 DNA-binding response regulator [Lachnospiraceae bacterium]BDF39074.1 DNA-binding response regulator [Lachnospiraceae bacterium]